MNGFKYFYTTLIILFHINQLFAHSKMVTSILNEFTHRWDTNRYYHSGSELTGEWLPWRATSHSPTFQFRSLLTVYYHTQDIGLDGVWSTTLFDLDSFSLDLTKQTYNPRLFIWTLILRSKWGECFCMCSRSTLINWFLIRVAILKKNLIILDRLRVKNTHAPPQKKHWIITLCF